MPPPTVNSQRGQLNTISVASIDVERSQPVVVTDRRRFIIHSLHFDFLPGGGGVNREICVNLRTGGNIFFRSCAPTTVPPGAGREFTAADFGFVSNPLGSIVPISLPPISLEHGDDLEIEIINFVAGDAITNLVARVESWVVGN